MLVRAVVWRLDQALGHAPEPRRSIEEPPVRLVRAVFDAPLIGSAGLETSLWDLSANLARQLELAGEGARRLCLKLYRSDGSRAEVRAGLSHPSFDASHFTLLLMPKLETLDAGDGVDAMTLEAVSVGRVCEIQSALVSRFGPASDGDSAVEDAAEIERCLVLLIDRLSNRVGPRNVCFAVASDSHLPERASRLASAIAYQSGAKPRGASAAPVTAVRSKRPLLMLATPEPIEVIAELPEGPPSLFRWRKARCRIARASGPERIAPEWWRHLPELVAVVRGEGQACRVQGGSQKDASPIAESHDPPSIRIPRPRDYYVLEDAHGNRYWVFRSGLYQQAECHGVPAWYVHGLFA
ncbi:MAG: hypothetical protein ACFCUN_03780 [Hyphomicrobiaceae bacterium]